MKPTIIIVGAGLSGLLLAYLLQKRFTVTLLEARERIGGRILCTASDAQRFDLGPTWVWPHQHHILDLAEHLGLKLFRHHDNGGFAYDAPEGVQYYQNASQTPSYRFENGTASLTNALHERLDGVALHLKTPVTDIIYDADGVTVETAKQTFEAAVCVFTLPPRLAAQTIGFEPPLPDALKEQMLALPTWMGFSAKCVVTYAEPFWRNKGLSGFATSHIGPLSEVHDACAKQKAALSGFYHTKSADEVQQEKVIEQLERLFGTQARAYDGFYCYNWRQDPFTSIKADRMPLSSHPHYGLDAKVHERLFLCGTESVQTEGGYLEGAVIAANRLANSLLTPNKHP